MMVKTIYSLLLVGTSGGVGLAAVLGWLNLKLYRADHDRRRKSLGLLLLGSLVQNGVLTYALINAGTAELNWRSVLYVLGLAVSTVAMAWKSGQFAQDLAIKEAVHNGESLWLKNVERRLTAEELRNTTIEHYAAAQALKQKESEKRITAEEIRGQETEGHE